MLHHLYWCKKFGIRSSEIISEFRIPNSAFRDAINRRLYVSEFQI